MVFNQVSIDVFKQVNLVHPSTVSAQREGLSWAKGGAHLTGMSIWRHGAKMSASLIFLAPVTKKPAPEIRFVSTQPVNSVGKACPPYFTARVYPVCVL